MPTAITGAGAAEAASASRASLADNFETFLTLLTEQMKNQDPLSPMDSTEFVNQLVQFSAVEQQINQNQNLETLIGLQLAMGQATAASYLGREVVISSDQAELKDGAAEWTYTLARPADTAKLLIQNAAGKVVYTGDAETASGAHDFAWDGKDNSGAALPPGVYTLSIAALNEAQEKITATITTSGRVDGVDFSGEEPALLIGGVRASLAGVRSLREPSPEPVT